MRPTRVWDKAIERPLNDSDIGLWERGSVRCLLRKPIAESVVAEEAHDANFAVETL
jgi:hypothetical protein